MKRVFMVHRWSGGPLDDWRPWLKDELEKFGVEVFILHMPDRDTPTIEKWVSFVSAAVGMPDEHTYFVGHSIGCQTIIRYLEKINVQVGGAVFVAGWFNLENLKDEEIKKTAEPWTTIAVDFKKVKSNLIHSTLFISDNDPYGATEENKEKFTRLGSDIVVLPEAGHITDKDGYTKIPEVLEKLKEMGIDK